jgi:hypothetical protein
VAVVDTRPARVRRDWRGSRGTGLRPSAHVSSVPPMRGLWRSPWEFSGFSTGSGTALVSTWRGKAVTHRVQSFALYATDRNRLRLCG